MPLLPMISIRCGFTAFSSTGVLNAREIALPLTTVSVGLDELTIALEEFQTVRVNPPRF